jgi:hypothetical protein
MKAKQQGFKSDVVSVGSVNLSKVLGSTVLEPKTFSSGKVGFYGQGAVMLKCGKEASYKFQVGINLTAIENGKQTLDEATKLAVLGAQPMTADALARTTGCQARSSECGGSHAGWREVMYAKIVHDHITIKADYHLADCRVLETDCADYDAFAALPRVVERDGVMFGLTGWNSDRGMAYYKNWIALAKVVR